MWHFIHLFDIVEGSTYHPRWNPCSNMNRMTTYVHRIFNWLVPGRCGCYCEYSTPQHALLIIFFSIVLMWMLQESDDKSTLVQAMALCHEASSNYLSWYFPSYLTSYGAIRGHAVHIWARNCGCLVTWFCYQLIAKPGNKTAAVLWSDPYGIKYSDKELLTHWEHNKRDTLLQRSSWKVPDLLQYL